MLLIKAEELFIHHQIRKFLSSINGLIMAGGRNSRLGRDKAFIEYHGKPQVLHLYEMLASLQVPAYISCRRSQADQFQGICPLIFDGDLSIGPLGGIFAAMEAYPVHDWLVIASDMPMVTERTLVRLMQKYGKKSLTTYKSQKKAFPEVLLTIYKKELLPTFRKAIHRRNYSLQTLLKSVEKHFVIPENELELLNVNTVEDLNAVLHLIRDQQLPNRPNSD